MLVLGTTGAGKAQPLSSKIKTPDGWITMAEAREGQIITTPDGNQSTIQKVFPQGHLDVYEIEFEDGRKTKACLDHLWSTNRGVIKTQDIINYLYQNKEVKVPLLKETNNKYKAFTIDPFTYGKDIERHLTLNYEYLNGSFTQKIELLNGLLSTQKEIYKFRTKNEHVLNFVQQLIWSMGHIAHKRDEYICFDFNQKQIKIKSITYHGKEPAQCILVEHHDHLYITDDYIVTHNTEFLLFLSAQAMAQGSGVIFVDGKGDVKTWFRLYSIAKRLGVEENLRVLNFGTNIKDGDLKYSLSNTINPFTLGDAGQLAEMMSALMADSGGDNAMWKGRAESMMRALLTALVDLRDIGAVVLGPGALSDWMPLDKLATLKDDPRLSDRARTEIRRYLDTLPGFNAGGQGKAEADKQHGFLTMQFTEILGLFNNAYAHIMSFKLGEIDMYDIITNRRSLYVMLPSMEKSGNSIKNLGKIVVNQIRAALSKTLGAGIEGSKEEKLEARPTNSKTPMLCILDEYGSYAVEGFGEVAAQARSIGFSTVFAVQDWASLEKADAKGNEALRIWANTNIKIIMKIEDSKSTMPLIMERIKKGYVLESSGKEAKDDSFLGGDRMQKTSRYHEVERIDARDLFLLENGGLFVLYKDRFHRVQSTYLDPDNGAWKNESWVAPERLLPMVPPSLEQIVNAVAMNKNWVLNQFDDNEDDLMDEDIPDMIEFFKEGMKETEKYEDSDYARKGLEFVRVFLRTCLQASSREANRLIQGKNDTSGSGGSSSASGSGKYTETKKPSTPWTPPVSSDIDEDDEEYYEDDEEYRYNDNNYEHNDEDPDQEAYPEEQNKDMAPMHKNEYVSGGVDIIKDPVIERTVSRITNTSIYDDDEEDDE
jgi:hypothetical protein